jgi:hypothetical protein
MIKLNNVAIDTKGTLGAVTLLTGVSPVYEYANGTRTGNVTGYRYEVALPERRLDKIDVVIAGPQLIDAPEGNQQVNFDGLELYIGWGRNGYELKARATGIVPAPRNK